MWLSDLIRKIKYGKAPPGLPAIVSAVAKEGENWITINGKKIELPSVVRHGLIFHTIFVVVLDINYNNMRNVLAFDGDGNRLWTIKKPQSVMKLLGLSQRWSGYISVGGIGSELVAQSEGAQFFINSKTGKIYDRRFDE